MQFEELDKKIREAAEQHHPAYDEKAWVKMHKLLNKHLPEEKDDRRRIIFFLLLFLLLGGGVFVLVSKPWGHSAGISKTTTEQTEQGDKPVEDNSVAKKGSTPNKDNQPESTTNAPTSPSDIDLTAPVPNSTVVVNKRSGATGTNKKRQTPGITNNNPAAQLTVEPNEEVIKNNKNEQVAKNQDVVSAPNISSTEKKIEEKIVSEPPAVVKENKPVNSPEEKKTTTAKSPRKNKNTHELVFSLSAGPDVSKAATSKIGRTTLAYGLGVSYNFNRFSLKTGIYRGRKVYDANAADYTLAYQLPPNLKFVEAEADCKVLEIPVDLSYNFGFNKNSNWFAGAGVSSYFMKRETYEYEYENTSTAAPSYRKYEVRNRNEHYFAILNLSGGYTHKLNSLLSVSAQPYLQIPLKGVGAGKVKLGSGGMMLSVGVHPFAKKK
jgi:hypothetical protein